MALHVQNTVIREFFEFSNLGFRAFWTIWFMSKPVCTGRFILIENVCHELDMLALLIYHKPESIFIQKKNPVQLVEFIREGVTKLFQKD